MILGFVYAMQVRKLHPQCPADSLTVYLLLNEQRTRSATTLLSPTNSHIMPEPDFPELIEKARAGDEAARNELSRRCRHFVRAMAQNLCDAQFGPVWDPSDAAQETMAEADRDFPAFRGTTSEELFAWLSSILTHTVSDRRKFQNRRKRDGGPHTSLESRNREGHALRDIIHGDDSSVSERVVRREDADRLMELIQTLPEDQATAVRLRHLEGLSVEEISDRMQRSEASVAGLLIRAMRRLRGSL